MTDPIVSAVKADLDARSARWQAKYATTLARHDLSLADWLNHAYEEALDMALYLKRAMAETRAGGAAETASARAAEAASGSPDTAAPAEAAGGQETGQSGRCPACNGTVRRA